MARANKTKAQAAKAGASPTWRVLKGTLVALLTVAVGVAAVYGVRWLRVRIQAAPTHQVSASSLRLAKGPAWMTPAILAELDVGLLDPDFPQRFSLLDEGVVGRIAAAYEKCPWVERVEGIVKRDPRGDPNQPPLEVRLKFRRPIAFVRATGGFCLVDDQGVRLPGVYGEPRLGATALLIITGVASSAPNVGEPWRDASLDAGVRVARAVAEKRQAFRLVSIDVANIGGRHDPRDTEVLLLTANGTRIKWGRAPTLHAAMLQEKTPDEKVAYLDFVYRHLNGQVDGVLAYIDIPNEAIRRRSADPDNRLRS